MTEIKCKICEDRLGVCGDCSHPDNGKIHPDCQEYPHHHYVPCECTIIDLKESDEEKEYIESEKNKRLIEIGKLAVKAYFEIYTSEAVRLQKVNEILIEEYYEEFG